MKRILSLVLVLGVVALFSGATLVSADCSYHKTQAAVPATDASASKDVATAPVDNKAVDQMQTAQATTPQTKPAPAPEPKK